MKRWIEKVPTVAWAIACTVALYVHGEPSEFQEIFVWSWFRLAGLVLLGVITLYCLVSLGSVRLLRANNYFTYLVVVVAAAFEVSFRVRPDLIPGEELILHASKDIRKQYALSRGYMTEELLSSEASNGLIYHFNPNERLAAYPHVEIDQYGYRNPHGTEFQDVDCVLLGDSLTLALDAREDLGALLRKQGYASRNLGMFGYSPQHYRDVYKKFIVDSGIRHRYVLVFIFAGNDVSDARNYKQVLEEKGDFHEYLPQSKSIRPVEEYLPLMVSVLRGLPRYMKSRLVTNRQRIIHLPYQVVTTGELLPPPRIQQESDDWKCLIEPVDEIVRMARAQGVTPMIFLLPSAATVYSQYDVTLARYDEHHQLIYDALQSHLATQAVPLSDLQQQLRVELHKHFIFAHQADYHLNSLGVQKVSEQVVTALRLMGHT